MRSEEEIKQAYENIKNFGFGSSYPPGVEPSEQSIAIGKTLEWVLGGARAEIKFHLPCRWSERRVHYGATHQDYKAEYFCVFHRRNTPCPYGFNNDCWKCVDYSGDEKKIENE